MPRLAFVAVAFLAVGLALGVAARGLFKKAFLAPPESAQVAGQSSPKALPVKSNKLVIVTQSAFNPDISVIGEGSRNFALLVNQLTGGEVEIKLTDTKVVPMNKQIDAVKEGTIDASFGWPGYLRPNIPAMAIFASLPFGPNPDELIGWMLQGGGEALLQELYARDGLHALMCGAMGPEAGGWFRREITKPEDFKDMKIRHGGLGGLAMAKLGADIQGMAAGEVYWAFDRADIDGAELSMPSVDKDFGIYKLAKYYYFPGWHQPAAVMDFVVTKEKWLALPERARAAIELACRANITWQLARALTEQGPVLEFYRQQGVTIRRWPPEVLKAMQAASVEVIRGEIERDEDFKRIWNNLNAYLSRSRDWSNMVGAR